MFFDQAAENRAADPISVGHRKKASESNAAWVVLLTFLGGVAGMVGVFVDVFWDFDPEVFVFYFPLFGLYLYLLRWA